ncbi:MAG: hypothetical protein JWO30_1655 [Fibrobacteres bacterium]|nr:hypothetical protein [Fibrobacterota bacterium]
MRTQILALGIGMVLGFGSVRAGVLTGTVRNVQGQALGGARLFLTKMPYASAPCGFGAILDSLVTGADGAFRFEAGHEFYALKATAAGRSEYCDFLEIKDSGTVRDILIPDTSNVGATITGVALLAGPGLERLPGVRIVLSQGAEYIDTLATDANGEFRIEGLADAPRYGVLARDGRFLDGGDVLADITMGQVRTLRMELERKPDMVGEPATVTGVVTDLQTGNPIPGARVSFEEVKARGYPYLDSARTDSLGRYRFSGIAPVTDLGFGYYLHVEAPRYYSASTQLFNLASKETRHSDFRLEKVLNLSVLVLESGGGGSGLPLPNTRVTLAPAKAGYPILIGRTDNAGRLDFPNLFPGVTAITIASQGYRTVYQRTNLRALVWDESLQVVLEKAAVGEFKSLQGSLGIHAGNWLQGFPILFHYGAGNDTAVLFDVSGPDGSFRMDGIPATCMGGILRHGRDSLVVTLAGPITQTVFDIWDIPIPASVHRSPVRKALPQWTRWFRDFNLLGRRPR